MSSNGLFMSHDTFEKRREADPQGVIDDLIAQTSRQAKAINDLSKELDLLKNPKKAKKGSHDGE